MFRDNNIYKTCNRLYTCSPDYSHSIHQHIQDYLHSNPQMITRDTVKCASKDLTLYNNDGLVAISDLFITDSMDSYYIELMATNDQSVISEGVSNAERICTWLRKRGKDLMAEVNLVYPTNHHNTIPEECNNLELTVLRFKPHIFPTYFNDLDKMLEKVERDRRNIIIPLSSDSCAWKNIEVFKTQNRNGNEDNNSALKLA